jgi:hypothetical protein
MVLTDIATIADSTAIQGFLPVSAPPLAPNLKLHLMRWRTSKISTDKVGRARRGEDAIEVAAPHLAAKPCRDTFVYRRPDSIVHHEQAGRREPNDTTRKRPIDANSTVGASKTTCRWQIVPEHRYVAAPAMVTYCRRTSKTDAPMMEDCRRQVHRFSDNCYKGYPTRVEAKGRYAHYLAGEMRDMRRNRMKTMAFVMMLIVTMVYVLCDCSLG